MPYEGGGSIRITRSYGGSKSRIEPRLRFIVVVDDASALVGQRLAGRDAGAMGAHGDAYPWFLIVLTVVLAPTAAALPGSHVEVGLPSILSELGVAALLGLSLAMLNELASLAGQLLGMQFSFSLVNLLDPNSEVQTPLLSQMLSLFEITVLLAAGLHRTILAALLHTFFVVPLGPVWHPAESAFPWLA